MAPSSCRAPADRPRDDVRTSGGTPMGKHTTEPEPEELSTTAATDPTTPPSGPGPDRTPVDDGH